MPQIAIPPETPIIVGIGQVSDPIDHPNYRAYSPADLAGEAAKLACRDAGAKVPVPPQIDAVVTVRTIADSRSPKNRGTIAPFGYPNNTPASIAKRIGTPRALGVNSPACGDEPQKLVGEFSERLAHREFRFVVITGGEATSTIRAAVAAGKNYNWTESIDGELDDRGAQLETIQDRHLAQHKLFSPVSIYPIFEQARRRRLGLAPQNYRDEVGHLLAPFTQLAATNPLAASKKILTADQIATIDDNNRMIADPHTRYMVARDQVNLGAAVLLTTVGAAREVGIPESKWVYLHGYADTREKKLMERPNLDSSPAMHLAYLSALDRAGVGVNQLKYLDLYSCFPIAVFNALDALGLEANDPRGLTLTGGLPFFGGPGNNYSMHGIVSLVEKLREDPGSFGIIGANGGYLTTHAVGVYSTKPKSWSPGESSKLQAELDAVPSPPVTRTPQGWANIESYTVLYNAGRPTDVIIIGRLVDTNQRFVALNTKNNAECLRRFVQNDGYQNKVFVQSCDDGNRFAFSEAELIA